MAKYWLSLLKKIFGSDIKSKSGKKERRRWVFGRVKSKRLPTLIAPPPLKEKTLSEAEEEHSRHALAVAIATAAAAEAAVAAAHAAAEVVRLTGTPKSSHRGSEKMSQEWAAITIQTAFRGYLARKALRALKGLVRLQALVRGRSVRRQAITTLKGLQSLIKIQSQVRANRLRMGEETPSCKEIAQVDSKTNESEDAKARLEPHSRKKWDGRSLPKDEIDAMFLSRQEAASKREQAIEYVLSHQERINSQSSNTSMTAKQEPNKLNWRWSWLEQWVDNQPWKREVLEKQFPLPSLDQSTNDQAQHRIDEEEETQLRKIEFKNEQFVLSQSPILLPRKSFHLTKCSSIRDDESFSISPTVPSYMAATESAKAKARSISTPKQRLGPLDTYLDHNSPSKNRLSSFPSISSDNGISIGKPPGCQQRSPRLKGLSGPVRSQQRTSKDISIESECSLLNWGQHRTFR